MSISLMLRSWLLCPILEELKKQEDSMAKTIEELKEAITILDAKVDEDITQTAAIISAINALIAKLDGVVLTPDVQELVDAVEAIATKVASDNPSVQAAIDAAATKTA